MERYARNAFAVGLLDTASTSCEQDGTGETLHVPVKMLNIHFNRMFDITAFDNFK